MIRRLLKLKLLPAILSCMIGIGCSEAIFSSASPEVKQVLINVTNRYLTNVAYGNEQEAAQLIYWPDFSGNGNLTLAQYHEQFSKIKNRWTPEENPLLGLVIVNVASHGNSAKVTLKKDPKLIKSTSQSSPEIWVKLLWAGRGWIVSEDSLFGSDKYFSTLKVLGR